MHHSETISLPFCCHSFSSCTVSFSPFLPSKKNRGKSYRPMSPNERSVPMDLPTHKTKNIGTRDAPSHNHACSLQNPFQEIAPEIRIFICLLIFYEEMKTHILYSTNIYLYYIYFIILYIFFIIYIFLLYQYVYPLYLHYISYIVRIYENVYQFLVDVSFSKELEWDGRIGGLGKN